MFAISDETKERVGEIFDSVSTVAKTTFHYGFIPFILFLGVRARGPNQPPLTFGQTLLGFF